MFFKEKVWEEVRFLYGLWREKFFIRGEEDFEDEPDINDEAVTLSNNNSRIYDAYEPSKLTLGEYGIPWRRVNEYYRDWNEYQEDNFKINKRHVSLLFRDVVL